MWIAGVFTFLTVFSCFLMSTMHFVLIFIVPYVFRFFSRIFENFQFLHVECGGGCSLDTYWVYIELVCTGLDGLRHSGSVAGQSFQPARFESWEGLIVFGRNEVF